MMIAYLVAHRTAASLILLLVTVLLSVCALALQVDPGAESVLPSKGPDLRDLRAFNAAFGADEVIVLALHSAELFTKEGLQVVDRLTREASKLPHVHRVVSPTNVQDLDGDELGPVAVVPYSRVLSGAMSAEEMGRKLGSHPLYGNLLVSRDARTAAILLDVERSETDSDYRSRLVGQVRALASSVPRRMTVHVAGIPVEKVDVAESVRHDQKVFAPLILGILAAATFALYRHPVGVLVPLGVVAASLLWTLGLYSAAGLPLNPVTSLITPVVLVVSVEGAIHLINHHLKARAAGLSPEASLARALGLSKVPCFNAAFTTAAGFGSLVFFPVPALRELGVFTAAGVMISYFLTMTLAPLLLAILPDFSPSLVPALRRRRLERALARIATRVARHPLPFAVVSLLVLGASAVGVGRIKVETDLIRSLRPASPLARATRFIDERLTGVNSLEILIRGITARDAAGLEKVSRFEVEIRSFAGIRQVTGYPDLARRVWRAFHEGQDAFARLPEGPTARQDLADIHDFLQEQAPSELSRFLSERAPVLRLSARAQALDTGASQKLFDRIRRAAKRQGLGEVILTGNFAVLSNMSTSLVANQVRGLVPAVLVILTCMAIQFRSLRLGLLSAVPTGAPVLIVYGLMGWIGIPLSVATAVIASITIGMTDDNTIHLLSGYREELARSGDHETALEVMMDRCGRAVVFSTLILAVGFWVGTLSSFLPSVHFAFLTGLTLLVGLACELVLLPLCLILFRPLGRPAPSGPTRGLGGARAVMAAALLLGSAGGSHAAAPAGVVLQDQFGRSDGPGLHRGEPVLLLYGRAPEMRRMKGWETRILKEKVGPLRILRAVDARSVRGRKTETEVNERLQKSVPKEISLLVDWEGRLARDYSLSGPDTAVVLLDARGRACGTERGPVTDDGVRRVLGLLSRIRKKGTCP